MKRYFYFTVVLVASLLLGSCKDFNSPGGSEYYVRYTISASYPYIFSDVTYSDVHGTGSMMNYQTRHWTETIGPVKKGFHASVKNAKGTATDKIEVSKDGGPFAIKASGQNHASCTVGD